MSSRVNPLMQMTLLAYGSRGDVLQKRNEHGTGKSVEGIEKRSNSFHMKG
jgi:hypothetical protein